MSRGYLQDLLRVTCGFIVCIAVGLICNYFFGYALPLTHFSQREGLRSGELPLSGMNSLSTISKREVSEISKNNSALILDARPAIFFKLGHIPNALNLPRETFDASYQRLQKAVALNRNQPIVIYCANSDCPDSHLVGKALQRLGYSNVRIFLGGWDEWTESHYTTQQGCNCGDD